MKKTTHLVLYAILFTCISILLIKQFIPNKVDSRSTLTKNTFEKKEIAKESPLRLNMLMLIVILFQSTITMLKNYKNRFQPKELRQKGKLKISIVHMKF